MSDYDWCQECDAFHGAAQHFPRWLAYEAGCPDVSDGSEDGRSVRAPSAESAAERFVQDECDGDSDCYKSCMDGIDVDVRDHNDAITHWHVSGEPSVLWSTHERAPKETP